MAHRNSSKGEGKGKATDQSQPPQSDHPSTASPSSSRPIKPLPTRSPAKAKTTLVDAHLDGPIAVSTPIGISAPSTGIDKGALSTSEPPRGVASSTPSGAPVAAAVSSNQPASEQKKKKVRFRKNRKSKQGAAIASDSNPALSTLPHPDPRRTAAAPTNPSSRSLHVADPSGPHSAPVSASSVQGSGPDYDDEEVARVVGSRNAESESSDRDLGGEEVFPPRGTDPPHPPAPGPPISDRDGRFDEDDVDPFNEGFYERHPRPSSSHESLSENPGNHDERFLDYAEDSVTPDRDIALDSAETRFPRNGVLQAREKLITMLEGFMNSQRFNWGHSHSPSLMPIYIELFGSVRFGLATEASDLDMCLCDPYRPEGFRDKFFSSSDVPNKSLPQIYNPRLLATKLQSLPYIRQAIPIPFANVPIVKIEAVIDGHVIQGDINTNERLGVLNSRLIKTYCELHPMFRPFCVFLKHWARSRELNDPSGSKGPTTMSSYTIILLAINYLQQINHLPNLQDKDLIESTSTEPTRFFSTPRVRKRHGKSSIQGSTGWDTTFVEDYPGRWYDGPVTMECGLLKEWVVGFFTYYSGEDPASFDSERQVVAIKLGRAMDRERRYRSSLGVLDGGIAGFAPATTGQDPASALINGTMDAEETGSTLIEDLRHLNIEPIDVRLASRSSSPIEYDHFEEPRAWQNHALVVQDPFYVERNTASNIRPEVVDLIKEEMIRAGTMVEMGFGIEQICQPLRPGEGDGAKQVRGRSRAKDHKGSVLIQGKPEQGRGLKGNSALGTKDGRAGDKSGRGGRGGAQSRRAGKNGAPPPPSESARPPLQRYATSSSEDHIVYQPPRK